MSMKLSAYIKPSPFTITASAVALLIIYLLPVRNAVFLRWMDDMSIYDPSTSNIEWLLHYPGGVLQLAGAFLSQFMYHPWVGSMILMALWGVLTALAIKAFRLRGNSSILALGIPMALLASILIVDETWLTIPSQGYLFSQTLGATITLTLLLLYRAASSFALRCIIAAITLLGFPFFGYYALLAWLLEAIAECAGGNRGERWHACAAAAAGGTAAVILPLIYHTYWTGTWAERKTIYLKGLPDLIPSGDDLPLWMPLIVMSALMLLLSLLSAFPTIRESRSRTTLLSFTGILGTMCIWCFSCSSKPEQWRAFVLMQHYMQRNEWGRIISIMNNIKEEPSREMILVANLAANMLGHDGMPVPAEKNGNGNGGSFRKNSTYTSTALLTVPLSYYIGRPNLSYRWAMEHCVKFGKRAYFIKYMTKCALVNGEYGLAKKYNDMLRRTIFHKEWAERTARFIDNPELMKEDPEFASIPANTATEVFF